MECSFECGCDFDNGPSCSSSTTRTARKPHKCSECRGTIQPGELYRYESGIWEGEPSSYKTCLDCLDLRNEFCTDGWTYGEVREMIREEIGNCRGDVPIDGLGKLRPGARNAFLAMVEAYWWEEEYEDGAPMRLSLRLDARMRYIHPRNDKYRLAAWPRDRMREARQITDACWGAAERSTEASA